MRPRRTTSLLLAAAFACAASGARAGDTAVPQVSPAPRPPATAVITSAPGLALQRELAVHEERVLFHLTGRRTATFAELKQKQHELAAAVDAGKNLPLDEREALAERLRKVGKLLFITEPLARGEEQLDPKLAQVLKAAGEADQKNQVDALMKVSGQLLQLASPEAARSPEYAARIFDALASNKSLAGVPGGRAKLDAVRADFGAKAPIAFSDPNAAHTLKAIMAPAPQPPAPLPAHAAPAPQTLTGSSGLLSNASAALHAALKPFRDVLPDGAEKKFTEDRAQMLSELRALAEKAERSLGGDPSAYRTFDELVDRLLKQEALVAKNIGVGGEITDWSKLPDRLAKVSLARPELGSFANQLWAYRSFLQQNLAAKQVPVPIGTHFRPWEIYPEGKGSRGATLEGYTRGGVGYVALAYDQGNGEQLFQGVNRDAHKALVIHKKGADVSVAEIDFDGEGKPVRTTTDLFTRGALVSREAHDSKKNLHEIRRYENGKEISTDILDAASGTRVIRDLVNGMDTTIDKNQRVEIKGKPAPPGTPPAVTLRVGSIDAYGNFSLEKMVTQDGQQIVVKSPEVTQLLDEKNNNLGWNVEVMGLVGLQDQAARQKKADSIATQTIKAVFGSADAEKIKALSGFLMDNAVAPADMADGKDGPPVRLSVNKHNEFSLILGHSKGTKTILTAVFQKPPVYRDRVQGGAVLGALHKATMGTDGRISPYDSSVEWQYLFDGSKIQWTTAQDDPDKTAAPWYKPWKDDEIVTHAFMRRWTRESGAWKGEAGAGWESKKDLLVEKKGSALGRIASSKPIEIVGGALNSVSMYAHAGWDAGLGAVTGSDAIKLEARTLWNNNPANRLFIKDPEKSLLGSLPAAQRAMLAENAVKNRLKNAESSGVTESRRPVDRRLMSEAAVSNNELMGAAANFSAGEYLGSHGHPVAGFFVSASGQVVEIAAGVAVTGGLASGIGKLTVGGVARFAPRLLPTVVKVGGAAVKVFDYTMMAAGGAMVVNDGINLAQNWNDDGARVANLGKVTADMGFVAFFAAQRFKGKGPGTADGAAPPEPAKLEIPPAPLDAPPAPAPAPKPTNLDISVPAGEPPPEIPTRMPDLPAARDPMGPREPGVEPSAPHEPATPREPSAPDPLPGEHPSPTQHTEGMLRTLRADAETLTAPRSGETTTLEPSRGTKYSTNEAGARSGAPELKPATESGPVKSVEVRPTVKAADVAEAPSRAPPESGNAGHEPAPRETARGTERGQASERVNPAETPTPKSGETPSRTGSDESGRVARTEPRTRMETAEEPAKGRSLKAGEEEPAVRGPKPAPEETTAKPAEEPTTKAQPRATEAEPAAKGEGETSAKPEPEPKPKLVEEKPVPEKNFLRRANDWLAEKEVHFKRFAGGSQAAHPMPDPVREPSDAKSEVVKVDDGPPGPVSPDPERKVEPISDPNVDPDPNPNVEPDPNSDPNERPRTNHPNAPPKQLVSNRNTGGPQGSSSPAGAGGGAAGGGEDKTAGKSAPKPPSPGGFGGGGGGGGGGEGGGNGITGGAGGPSDPGPAGGRGGASAPADISAAAPAGARPGAFASAPTPARKPSAAANFGDGGGHSPAPSLAARFDGSVQRPKVGDESAAASMKGLGAAGADGLPHLTAHELVAKAPTVSDSPLKDGTAASAAPVMAAAPARAPGAKPEEEDYSYTYLAPTRHKYELPTDPPKGAEDWRYLADLGLRASAILAVIYLGYHSDLPYLVGMTRRRRKNGTSETASKIV
jgi:hypothetical protein